MVDWITTSMIPCVCAVVHASVHKIAVCVCITNGQVTASISSSAAQASCESYIFFMLFSFIPLSIFCLSLCPSTRWRWRLLHYRNTFIFCVYHGAELISIPTVSFTYAGLHLSTIRQQQPQCWWLIEAMHTTDSYYGLGKPPSRHQGERHLTLCHCHIKKHSFWSCITRSGHLVPCVQLWARYHSHNEIWFIRRSRLWK